MRLAVQNPYFITEDQTKNFNGYNFEFLNLFKPVIFLTNPNQEEAYRIAFSEKGLNPEEYQFITDIHKLNADVEALICFNGRPDIEYNMPPKDFLGLKVFHVMDYVFRAKDSNSSLEDGGVDYVMGYANHGKYCKFFKKYYQKYIDKVIPVPFGFGKRFENLIPFEERNSKVIALGSVNPVDDPMVTNRMDLMEYIAFYQNEVWTHKWRRMLSEFEIDFTDILDSLLPHFPQTKNPNYDANSVLNQYQMFANDEGLMAFPPARTYEGTAAGAILVASNHECYRDLGFIDGQNCILHEELNVFDFYEKVSVYLENPSLLVKIARNSVTMVKENYSHQMISKQLYQDIKNIL